jgi:hypothetical protein
MKSTGGCIIAAIIVLAIGIMNIVKPEIAWKLKHLLTVRDGEPTEFFIVNARITGVVLVGFSLLVLFWAFTGRI